MKLWRKQAKKDPVTGQRNGRQIRQQQYISEQMFKNLKLSYPLLDALIERSGITFVMSKKEQAMLKQMIEKEQEQANETK